MRQAIIALVLILDLLVCPFACHGFVVTSESGDSCCPSKRPCSGDNAPVPPGQNNDASCGSCLCGGATSPEQARVDFEIAQNLTPTALLPILSTDLLPSATSLVFELQGDSRGLTPPSGAALRALLQSFVL